MVLDQKKLIILLLIIINTQRFGPLIKGLHQGCTFVAVGSNINLKFIFIYIYNYKLVGGKTLKY